MSQNEATTCRTECGFCEGGVFFSSRRSAQGLPPEVPCPYCNGSGLAPESPDVRRRKRAARRAFGGDGNGSNPPFADGGVR